jgi:serine O-acetyltransferase
MRRVCPIAANPSGGCVTSDIKMKNTEITWNKILNESLEHESNDALSRDLINRYIRSSADIGDALSQLLSDRLNSNLCQAEISKKLFIQTYKKIPHLLYSAALDLEAVIKRDPAASRICSAFLFSKGYHAVQIYRLANWLWKNNKKFTAEALSSGCCASLGVDIHPGAQIGHGILLDHADGIVIGETTIIGENVTIFHGVTLGSRYEERGNRHPKISNGVMLGANSTIIGNINIGENSRIGCGAVVLSDIGNNSIGVGVPAKSKKLVSILMNENVRNDNYII